MGKNIKNISGVFTATAIFCVFALLGCPAPGSSALEIRGNGESGDITLQMPPSSPDVTAGTISGPDSGGRTRRAPLMERLLDAASDAADELTGGHSRHGGKRRDEMERERRERERRERERRKHENRPPGPHSRRNNDCGTGFATVWAALLIVPLTAVSRRDLEDSDDNDKTGK